MPVAFGFRATEYIVSVGLLHAGGGRPLPASCGSLSLGFSIRIESVVPTAGW